MKLPQIPDRWLFALDVANGSRSTHSDLGQSDLICECGIAGTATRKTSVSAVRQNGFKRRGL